MRLLAGQGSIIGALMCTSDFWHPRHSTVPQACTQSCQTSCQTLSQECSQTCSQGGSQACSPACSWRAHSRGPCGACAALQSQILPPKRGRIARCARAVHKVCTVPYPNCIVVASINNNEARTRSPSPPPSPSQPGRSLLASLEAKQRDPPPSRRSNTPSTLVSQPRAASRPARSPSASTASSPSVLVQRTSHLRSGTFTLTGQIAFTRNIKAEAQKRACSEDYATPVRTTRSATLPFDRFACLWHWKVIRDIWMGSAHDCGLG